MLQKLSGLMAKLPLPLSIERRLNPEVDDALSSLLASHVLDPQRPNRYCVAISDLHLTDGTVNTQHMDDSRWEDFRDQLSHTCHQYQIEELVLVLNGDVVDMVRSGQWAKNGVYPWERHRSVNFTNTVNAIIREIINRHPRFFNFLQTFDTALKQHCSTIKTTEIVILLGNHDKELMIVNEALAYFYEVGLGKKLADFSESKRREIGRMYGDESMFLHPKSAPYFPFYYADKGFRFFTTHGQWRDRENSREIEPTADTPGWSVNDGWQPVRWQQQGYAPFLSPCFGDTVTAGILSTFIYDTRHRLSDFGCSSVRLERLLDELDLYRPSYLALQRMLTETKRLKKSKQNPRAVEIIESNINLSIQAWLNWDFTYQSAPKLQRILLRIARQIITAMQPLGLGLKSMSGLMKLLAWINYQQKQNLSRRELRQLPGFLPRYQRHGLQIHGEGHTHQPWQEEVNLKQTQTNDTYVNFGTYRDQMVSRKNHGYRRRSVLRTFHILDLQAPTDNATLAERDFRYYTQDMIIWQDKFDNIGA